MQERNVPETAKQDTIFDSRPAYQFCSLMESTIINYLAFALKYDRFNDDMDSVREHLQRLKYAAKTAQQLVQNYEENRVIPPQKSLLSKNRSDVALKKSRQAEEKFKELQNEYDAVQKDLRLQEVSLKDTIAMAEENEEYRERQRNIERLASLTKDKNSLALRHQDILEKKKNKFLSFLSDNNKDANELTHVEAQQRKVDIQLRMLNKEMARKKNKFEYLPKRKNELEMVQEKIKYNDEIYQKKIQAAKADLDMAEARLFMESVETARYEINYYALVKMEISFALLRSYIRFMEMNESIECAYNAMVAANKTYRYNPGDTFKDPLARIKGLYKIINKSTSKISTMAGLVRCLDLEEKDILELYEAYKSMPVYIRKKFMDEPAALDFHSIFALCLSDLPQKESNPRPGTVSTLFLQAKEQNRNSVNAQSLAASVKPGLN